MVICQTNVLKKDEKQCMACMALYMSVKSLNVDVPGYIAIAVATAPIIITTRRAISRWYRYPGVEKLSLRVFFMAACAIAFLVAHTGAHAASGEDSTYNFLAIADWGDDGVGQKAAAIGLGVIAEQIGAKQASVHSLFRFAFVDRFVHRSLFFECSHFANNYVKQNVYYYCRCLFWVIISITLGFTPRTARTVCCASRKLSRTCTQHLRSRTSRSMFARATTTMVAT